MMTMMMKERDREERENLIPLSYLLHAEEALDLPEANVFKTPLFRNFVGTFVQCHCDVLNRTRVVPHTTDIPMRHPNKNATLYQNGAFTSIFYYNFLCIA